MQIKGFHVAHVQNNILFTLLTFLILVMSAPVRASTLVVTYSNETPVSSAYADFTTLTFRFATENDGDNLFTFANLFDRIWHSPELIGQGTNLPTVFGTAYPVSNLQGTTYSSTGGLYDSSGNIVGSFIDFKETLPANGSTPSYAPIDISYYRSANNMTVQALWSPGNGGQFRFYRQSFTYDATGRAADFVSAVPLPASGLLFATALAGLGVIRRRRAKAA